MLSSIKGRLYTVTGAASGIGRATAIKLAQLGAAGISISDVDEAGLSETKELCTYTSVDQKNRKELTNEQVHRLGQR
jgi:NAD(P)-dependent dehydrogenase (short-subunit alcohol dehydrogenase family)